MRLIDADKLKRTEGMFQYQINDAFDQLSTSAYTFEDVENAPTVEAISVEFVKKRLLPKKYEYDNDYGNGFNDGWNCALRALLKDWKKKNEI